MIENSTKAASPLLATPYPITPREEVRFTLEGLALAARCQVTSPVRFASASTANVARDMDLLRQAVAAGRRQLRRRLRSRSSVMAPS